MSHAWGRSLPRVLEALFLTPGGHGTTRCILWLLAVCGVWASVLSTRAGVGSASYYQRRLEDPNAVYVDAPGGGSNIVVGLGLYTGGLNSQAVAALWKAACSPFSTLPG